MDWLAAAAKLDDDRLGGEWTWTENPRGETLQVRDALYALLENELDAAARVRHDTYASAQMAMAQAAFGDLRGLLAGSASQLLDSTPAEGEWTIRQTLKHMLEVELSYRSHIEWAVTRKDSEPVRRPDSMAPKPDETVLEGNVAAVLDRLAAARARTDSSLSDIKEEMFGRPSIWVGHDVDVAFRLRRFASHISEHTIQVEKALDSLSVRLGEARRIARRMSAARGLHERKTSAERLGELDRRAAARISSLA